MDECPCYYKGTWYSEGDQITDNCFIKYVMTPSLDCPSGQSWNRFSVDVDNNGDGNNVYNVVEVGHAKDTATAATTTNNNDNDNDNNTAVFYQSKLLTVNCLQLYCPIGISPKGDSGCFPRGQPAATESRYPIYCACWVF